MSDNGGSSGGVGFGTVLFLVFMVLKLTETIDWSWWWITSPLWISAALILVSLAIVLFVSARGNVWRNRNDKWRDDA